jgi:hypothetical protein
MRTKNLLFIWTAFISLAANAVNVPVYDSIVSLATNGVKQYTFTDPMSGAYATIEVTMSPYSSGAGDPFTVLDANARIAIGASGGDANWIDADEGVDFTATLISASGIAADSVQFGISSLGLRPEGGTPRQWTSSAGTVSFITDTEGMQTLDTNTVSLNGTNYSAQLRSTTDQYQLSDVASPTNQGLVLNASFSALSVLVSNNPRTNSWLTAYSSKYARVYTNDTMAASGTSLTTWGNTTLKQTVPVYCGVQQILSSSNYVYIRTTGLGSHIMGPWYNNAAHTALFVNFPTNQKAIYRIPATPVIPPTHTYTQLGEIGMMVDGVRIFDANDAFSYSTSHGADANPMSAFSGDGIWNRDAWVNEGLTMDPAKAHQQNSGRYHYHATPTALRYLLGDHVDFNFASKIYSESTNPVTKHSPIIGWLQDGLPLYGPYGYSSPSNSASGVRRMISGFVARNGSNGTTNLAITGRHTLPAWAARTYNRSVALAANQYGPDVNATYPIGQYLEDYDYRGDIGGVQGTDFDLDEYNVRWCVTPEFPQGTYAYFTTITVSNTPAYPYNMGRLYYGTPSGGLVTSINQNVTTNFNGGPDTPSQLDRPAYNNGSVTLVWSATEGGSYRVESTTNMSSWITNATAVSPSTNRGSYTIASPEGQKFFRVARTALTSYDSAFGSTGILSISPTNHAAGTFTLTINLDPSVGPPPQMAPVNSVTVGSINGISHSHVSQTQVTSSITIPGGTTPGPVTVSVTFPGPPDNPSSTVTYTLPNGFTIN